MRELDAKLRKQNFRNVIRKKSFISYFTAIDDEQTPSIGVQWYSYWDSPSRITGYPDQPYYCSFHLIFMFGQRKFEFEIRGKKMPYRNYEEWFNWHKQRQRNRLNY